MGLSLSPGGDAFLIAAIQAFVEVSQRPRQPVLDCMRGRVRLTRHASGQGFDEAKAHGVEALGAPGTQGVYRCSGVDV